MNNGHFWACYIRDTVIPEISLLEDIVHKRVLRAFDGLDAEAERISAEKWDRLVSRPGDGEEDCADLAEQAQEAGIEFYLTAKGIQQGITNVMVVALHHLYEQQMLYIYRKELLSRSEEDNGKLLKMCKVEERLAVEGHDITELDGYDKLDELRLVANVVKHTDGQSADSLRLVRPDMFKPPALGDDAGCVPFHRTAVYRPLMGEDLYVSLQDLDDYFEAARRFWLSFRSDIVRRPE